MKKSQLQQGDVLLNSIDKLPSGLKARAKDQRGVVLAEGEVTGHYHAIANEEGVSILDGPNGTMYLVNETAHDVVINHQEHKPISVPPGNHEIKIVQEHDYLTEMVRPVQD